MVSVVYQIWKQEQPLSWEIDKESVFEDREGENEEVAYIENK